MLNDMLKALTFHQPANDNDWVDSLHSYTITVLIILSLLVSYKSFSGRPVECWLPGEFKGSWEQYTGKRLNRHL